MPKDLSNTDAILELNIAQCSRLKMSKALSSLRNWLENVLGIMSPLKLIEGEKRMESLASTKLGSIPNFNSKKPVLFDFDLLGIHEN